MSITGLGFCSMLHLFGRKDDAETLNSLALRFSLEFACIAVFALIRFNSLALRFSLQFACIKGAQESRSRRKGLLFRSSTYFRKTMDRTVSHRRPHSRNKCCMNEFAFVVCFCLKVRLADRTIMPGAEALLRDLRLSTHRVCQLCPFSLYS